MHVLGKEGGALELLLVRILVLCKIHPVGCSRYDNINVLYYFREKHATDINNHAHQTNPQIWIHVNNQNIN